MELKLKYEATVSFDCDVIDVTDPCYDKDVWCRSQLKILPGKYNVKCYVSTESYLFGAGRPFILSICHEKYKQTRHLSRACTIGVDAGLAGFFENKPDYSDCHWHRFCEELAYDDFATCTPEDIERCNGVYCRSGDGDGGYPVMVRRNSKGLVVEAEIRF